MRSAFAASCVLAAVASLAAGGTYVHEDEPAISEAAASVALPEGG